MENSSKDGAMAELQLEAHGIVRMAAEPWTAGDGCKEGLRRAAMALRELSYRRIKTLWYCEPCSLRAAEMDYLRRRYTELLHERMRRLDAERAVTAARIAALEESRAEISSRVAALSGKNVGTRSKVGAGALTRLQGAAREAAGAVIGRRAAPSRGAA